MATKSKASKTQPANLHEHLWRVVKKLPSDFEPYGRRQRAAQDEDDWVSDCSCGCRHFLPLEGKLGYDWGVCANPKSPRCGLLTFEHQGCREFEPKARAAGDSPGWSAMSRGR